MKTVIKGMTPEDIFILFGRDSLDFSKLVALPITFLSQLISDEDDSGLISFEEFRKMMPFLDVIINDAKALRYFRLCDTDGSGEIDIDEFKVALYLCDPVYIKFNEIISINIIKFCSHFAFCSIYRQVEIQLALCRANILPPWMLSRLLMRY